MNWSKLDGKRRDPHNAEDGRMQKNFYDPNYFHRNPGGSNYGPIPSPSRSQGEGSRGGGNYWPRLIPVAVDNVSSSGPSQHFLTSGGNINTDTTSTPTDPRFLKAGGGRERTVPSKTESYDQLTEKIKGLKKNVQQYELKINSYSVTINEIRSSKQQIEEKLASEKKLVAASDVQKQLLAKKVTELQEELDANKLAAINLNNTIKEVCKKSFEYQLELAKCQKRLESFEKGGGCSEEDLNNLKRTFKQQETESAKKIEELNAEVAEMQAKYEAKEKVSNHLCETLSRQVTELQQQTSDQVPPLMQEVERLKDEVVARKEALSSKEEAYKRDIQDLKSKLRDEEQKVGFCQELSVSKEMEADEKYNKLNNKLKLLNIENVELERKYKKGLRDVDVERKQTEKWRHLTDEREDELYAVKIKLVQALSENKVLKDKYDKLKTSFYGGADFSMAVANQEEKHDAEVQKLQRVTRELDNEVADLKMERKEMLSHVKDMSSLLLEVEEFSKRTEAAEAKYYEASKEILDLKNEMKIQRIRHELEGAPNEEALTKTVMESENRISHAKLNILKLRGDIASLNKEKEKMSIEVLKIREDFLQTSSKLVLKIRANQEEIDRLDKVLEERKQDQQHEENKSKLSFVKKELEDCKSELASATKNSKAELKAKNKEIKSFKVQISQDAETITKLQEEVAVLKQESTSKETELQNCKDFINEQNVKYTKDLEDKVSHFTRQVDILESYKLQMTEELNATTEKYYQETDVLNTHHAETVTNLRTKLTAAYEEIKDLKSRLLKRSLGEEDLTSLKKFRSDPEELVGQRPQSTEPSGPFSARVPEAHMKNRLWTLGKDEDKLQPTILIDLTSISDSESEFSDDTQPVQYDVKKIEPCQSHEQDNAVHGRISDAI